MGNTFNNRIIEPYLYSCDSIITEVNKEFIDFTGFTMDELLGKSLIEIGDMIKINSQILLGNINSKYSGYIFTKSLSAREVNISLSHGIETNEEVYTFVEKPNSRLDDKLIFVKQTFIDNISGVAIYSVPDLILLKANQKYLDLLDAPFNKEENSIGRPIREIVTGFVGSQSEVIWSTVLETQKTNYIKESEFEFEFEFDKFTRGTTYWDSTYTPIFENGNMKYIFETAIEVTERVLKNQSIERQNKIIQHQKEQLENQNAQLAQKNIQLISIIENLSEGVVIADNKGKLIMVNPEAKRLLYQSEKLIALGDAFKNTKYFDMKGNEIPFENLPGIRALRGERVKNAKMFVSNPNKEYFMEASSIPIYNTKKLQEEFLANISHELKTPLNVIFATAELFNMYCNSGSLDERKNSIIKYIGSIKQNSYRLSKLINNIVDISKIKTGFFELNLSNNNIVEVVEEIVMSVTNFTDSKGLNIIFDTDIEEKFIACDTEKIERIVLNLISNAIKFSNEGDEIFVDVKDKNEFVEISIKDNGIGIEDKYLDMIFDRFKQIDKSLSRNTEGTGIGLSLVKSIVELHGGSIYVESEFEKGSKFTVMLPSRKVLHENKLYSSKVRSGNESIQVELSDVYS